MMVRRGDGVRRHHSGVTLVELLVVLAILGVVASIVGFSIATTPSPNREETALSAVATARTRAIHEGESVSVVLLIDGRPRAISARPDGSVIADSGISVERLGGRPRRRASGSPDA